MEGEYKECRLYFMRSKGKEHRIYFKERENEHFSERTKLKEPITEGKCMKSAEGYAKGLKKGTLLWPI